MLLVTVRFAIGRLHAHGSRACGRQNGYMYRESEQTRELQRFPQLEQRRQRLRIGAAGGSIRTFTLLFPRALPLDERCTVVDAVSTATRTPPRVPLRARAEKSPHSSVCLEETACGALLLTERI